MTIPYTSAEDSTNSADVDPSLPTHLKWGQFGDAKPGSDGFFGLDAIRMLSEDERSVMEGSVKQLEVRFECSFQLVFMHCGWMMRARASFVHGSVVASTDPLMRRSARGHRLLTAALDRRPVASQTDGDILVERLSQRHDARGVRFGETAIFMVARLFVRHCPTLGVNIDRSFGCFPDVSLSVGWKRTLGGDGCLIVTRGWTVGWWAA